MKVILTAILFINSTTLLAVTATRSCPENVASPDATTLGQFSQELQANNISVVPGNTVQPANVDMFLQSYRKFPQSLRNEMVGRNARIVIMEGEGVKTDPTFTGEETFDGRDWSKVPGSGGEVSRHFNIPTRIVVNSLTHNHGSSDLVLHEHAHTLDSLYGTHGVSRSGTWHNLMGADPAHLDLTKSLCGDYCTQNPEEAFAELFAYYFNCEESRKHMEEEVPQLASFFQNLNSVKDLLEGSPQKPATSVFVTPVVASRSVASTDQKEECLPTVTQDIADKVKPLTNLTPYLQNYPQPGTKPNYFQVTYPVYPKRNTGVSAPGMK